MSLNPTLSKLSRWRETEDDNYGAKHLSESPLDMDRTGQLQLCLKFCVVPKNSFMLFPAAAVGKHVLLGHSGQSLLSFSSRLLRFPDILFCGWVRRFTRSAISVLG